MTCQAAAHTQYQCSLPKGREQKETHPYVSPRIAHKMLDYTSQHSDLNKKKVQHINKTIIHINIGLYITSGSQCILEEV